MAKPNIIQIVADDMGYGDFAVFNAGITQTPSIDRLVAEGLCLTQHYAGSCVCAPSRAALLTGRYPHRTGAIDTFDGRGLDRLALRERTIGNLLGARGYTTGLIGKWHNGALDSRYHPNARGFQEFAGFSGGWQDYYQWRLDRNGSFQKSDGRYLTDVFTEEAVDFIRRHARRGRPFFLHLAYNAPHFPFQAPVEEVKPFAASGRYNAAVSTLYGMIARMDAGIGRVLEELQRQGIARNTLVMFTSDNGPQFGRANTETDTRRFNCGFRGWKGSVYEGGIRVPMVLRWPDGLEAGRHLDAMVHFVDWLPTLLAAAGEPIASDNLPLDGQNVLPVLRGEGGRVETRRFWQWNRYTPVPACNAAMRDGDWKLVRPTIREAMAVSPQDAAQDKALRYQPDSITDICRDPEPRREIPPPPPPQLFNIAQDPAEERDLAESEPDRTRRMVAELDKWFEQVERERRSIQD